MTRPCVLSASAALFILAVVSGCAPEPGPGNSGGQGGNAGSGGSGGSTSGANGGNSGRGGGGGSAQSGSGGSQSASGGSSGSGGSTGSGGRPAGSGGQTGSGGQAGSSASGGTSGGSGGTGGSSAGDAGAMPETPAAGGPKLSTDVLPIVKASCARAGCHDPVKKEHGMDLSTAATIYAGWVNKMTADHCMNNAAVTRIVPGMPDRSFVVTLIRNLASRCAEVRRMPPAPLPALTAAEVKTITDWVAAGALNN